MLKALIGTSALTAMSVAARGISLLLISKLLATVGGPSAYAALGNFQNVFAATSLLATGSTSIGITKYTAELYDAEDDQRGIWRAGFTTTLFASLFFALVLIAAAGPVSLGTMGTTGYEWLVYALAAALLPSALNLVLLAILNGKKAIAAYVLSNIAASLALLALTYLLLIPFGWVGAIIALIVHQAATLPLTAYLTWKQPWFSWDAIVGHGRRIDFERLGKYAAMAIVSAIMAPLAQYLTRQFLTLSFDADTAGLWEAVNRFSAMYLLVVISPLTVYYLPRLSEIRTSAELRKEVRLGYTVILPAAAIMAAVIYLFRHQIILLLFSQDFLPMSDLMAWQAIGDVLKIGSWLLGFIMLARGMRTAFITTEIVFSCTSILLIVAFTWWLGPIGAPIGYTVNYAIYWVAVALVVRPLFLRLT